MVAEGHHLPEDQVMPRLQEQSYSKEHKANQKRCYWINGGRRPPFALPDAILIGANKGSTAIEPHRGPKAMPKGKSKSSKMRFHGS